ncbi:unnamed protein product [Musa banksii]
MRLGLHLVHPFTFLYSFRSNSSTAVLLQSLTASFLLAKSGFFLPNHAKTTRQNRAHPTPSPRYINPTSLSPSTTSSHSQFHLLLFPSQANRFPLSKLPSLPTMEAGRKLVLFTVAMMAVVMASSLVEKVAAVDAPAPSPTSGAVTAPAAPAAVLASISVLLFGYFLC